MQELLRTPQEPTPQVMDRRRLNQLAQLALLDTPTEQAFDRLTRLATQVLHVPVALVSLVDHDRQFFKSCVGIPEPWATTRQTPLSHSFCQYVVATGEPLIIPDARADPLTQDNLAIRDLDVIAYAGFPLCTPDGYVLGSFCVIDHEARAWTTEEIDIVRELTVSVATEVDLRAEVAARRQAETALLQVNTELEQRVGERTAALSVANGQLREAYDATLAGWARFLELRDKETQGHTQRVTELTVRLAVALGYTGEELLHIRRGALLHDMGKMGIPDRILLKPGPLTDDEWAIMRRHPRYVYDLLQPIEFLQPALAIPYSHHEKWDGTGYPQGLSGEQIPLPARIFAVVDVWDALCSDRPYRKGWPVAYVRRHIVAQSGMHFDPQVVRLFLSIMDEEVPCDALPRHPR